ncbi:MAG: PilZ domain-containing protein [Nitrospinota bacterium]|nr:PilZ domain-containing protein [Nitrospinota bacterium]
MIVQPAGEIRGSFRVKPSPDEPIKFKFQNKIVSVSDISAGGLSFPDENFSVGVQEFANFQLPGDETKLEIKLGVISIIEAKNICCCRFLDLTEENEAAIYDYALRRQKEDLQNKKLR